MRMVNPTALLLLVTLALLLLQSAKIMASGPSYCDNYNPPVPPCKELVPRDLLFMVDGSNSMNRNKFYGEMLEYCLALYCSFSPALSNQAGMIVFNKNIQVVIPLAQYSRQQWEVKVNGVRADQTQCCSCCTPTAEAFDRAYNEFEARGKNVVSIAFTITDGVPSNNNAKENGVDSIPDLQGNPAWWWYSVQQGFDPAVYNYKIVPQRALNLKDAGHRLMLIGVPDSNGDPPDKKYFNGGLSGQQCVSRQGVSFCSTYNKPPFPIVSTPVGDNSFSTKSWNVASLIALTVDAVCIVPTTAPTTKPSNAPTTMPTRQPTNKPTNAPLSKPPTKSPTNQPSHAPTFVYLDQVDVTFLIDRSKSMVWHDSSCKATVDASPSIPGTLRGILAGSFLCAMSFSNVIS
jgi:hypothetical protein